MICCSYLFLFTSLIRFFCISLVFFTRSFVYLNCVYAKFNSMLKMCAFHHDAFVAFLWYFTFNTIFFVDQCPNEMLRSHLIMFKIHWTLAYSGETVPDNKKVNVPVHQYSLAKPFAKMMLVAFFVRPMYMAVVVASIFFDSFQYKCCWNNTFHAIGSSTFSRSSSTF